ncbi:PEBP-like protein, partial [Polyplosphaeria fusca]
MKFTTSIFIVALAGIAQAQTPQGFQPAVNTTLNVMFNATAVAVPGEKLTKAQTASQPQLALSQQQATQSTNFMFVMLDLDVPPANGSTTRRTLLHALVTDFKPTAQAMGNGTVLLQSQARGPATYLGPSPPATDSTPHRYVEMIFAQPQTLSVTASSFSETQSRIGFDIQQFMQQNGLAPPVAANFFTVDGQAGGSGTGNGNGGASGTATTTGGISRNTLQPFEGKAGRMEMGWGLAGVVGAMALV